MMSTSTPRIGILLAALLLAAGVAAGRPGLTTRAPQLDAAQKGKPGPAFDRAGVVSFRWSRTIGSFDNETASNAADTDLASNGNFANPNRAINTTGRTVFDRPHDVRVFGTYLLPYWGVVRVGGVYRYTTGAP